MSSRVVGWATGVAVVLGAAQALAINKVDAGTGWRIAAVACTILLALLAGGLAFRAQRPSGQPAAGSVQGPGSVVIGGRVKGSIRTRVDGAHADSSPGAPGAEGVLGAGAVRVDATGEVGQDIATHVAGTDRSPSQ